MGEPTTVFEGHHVLEQKSALDSPLVQKLMRDGLFDLHGPRNMLNLPAKQVLAAQLDVSPHTGGPLDEYSLGVQRMLNELEGHKDWLTMQEGGPAEGKAAAVRMAQRVDDLSDTLKTAMVNGDLVCNAPHAALRQQTNQSIKRFFTPEHYDQYAEAHAEQIARLGELGAAKDPRARWAAVTQSESNVLHTLDAIDDLKPLAGTEARGRKLLGQAILRAEASGELVLSDAAEARVHGTFPKEVAAGAKAAAKAAHAQAAPDAPEPGAPRDAPDAPPAKAPPESRAASALDAAPDPVRGPQPPGGPVQGPEPPRATGAVHGAAMGPDPVSVPEASPRMPQSMPVEGALPEGNAAHPAAGSGRFARVAGAVGMATMAYDLIDTGHHVVQLRSQGNRTGEDSAEAHFVARNAGGFVSGFVAGAGYGWATGSLTGPGAFVSGLVGGIGGGMAAEVWADYQDRERIYTQQDPSGKEWHREPDDTVWRNGDSFVLGGLAERLDYQSAKASYELGLAHPPTPIDPYAIAGELDPRGWHAGPWRREAETGGWSRTVIENASYPAAVPDYEVQFATPGQTKAFEAQSQLTIAQNAANTPAATAARFQVAYEYCGWARYGPVPPAVQHAAAQTRALQASDGSTYVHGDDGQWRDGDRLAAGQVRVELDATWQSQQAGLQDLAVLAQEAQTNSAALREKVDLACYDAGLNLDPKTLEAMSAAVARVHLRTGVDPSNYGLQLEADGSIAARAGPHGEGPVILRTGPAEIVQSMQEHGLPSPVAPVPTAASLVAPAPPPAERYRTHYEYEPASTPSPDVGHDRPQQHGASPPPDAPVAQAAVPPPVVATDAPVPSPGFRVAMSPATVRAAGDTEHEDRPVRLAVDAPSSSAAPPFVPLQLDRDAPRAPALDDPRHPNHGMYDALSQVVAARDAAMGREPDQASRQLAAGLVADARDAGLQSIGFAQFSPDGSRVYMTDTRDPSSPLARTAIGDVAQAVQRPLEESQAHVERSGAAESQQAARMLAQDVSRHDPTQSAPTHAAPRMM